VRHRAKKAGVDAGPYLTIVGETLERYQQSGLVDDRRFGATMARSLAERGASRQAIKAKLLGRGLPVEVIDEVVNGLNHAGNSELDAAEALVRKRKLGKYRAVSHRRENFRRDLGVLARAGFSLDTAKAALGVADEGEGEGL
jgi:regulatory protein